MVYGWWPCSLGEVIVQHQLNEPRHNFVRRVKLTRTWRLELHDWLLDKCLMGLESIFGLRI